MIIRRRFIVAFVVAAWVFSGSDAHSTESINHALVAAWVNGLAADPGPVSVRRDCVDDRGKLNIDCYLRVVRRRADEAMRAHGRR